MERGVVSATCIAQHIETFRKQAAGDAKADFGEPCQNCPMNKECNFDWLSNMAPLLKDSMVKIRMVLIGEDEIKHEWNKSKQYCSICQCDRKHGRLWL